MANYTYGPDNKDVNAIHPRLTTGSGSHNDRNSDYWLYKNSSFMIPAMQLMYHFTEESLLPFIKDTRVYVRAPNVLVTGKTKRIQQVRSEESRTGKERVRTCRYRWCGDRIKNKK